MELKIACDTQILVDNFEYVTFVKADIKNYLLEKSKLEGNVIVTGNYHDKEENKYSFEKEVPFTIVFSNENYMINKVEINNLKSYEIVHSGIECHFEITVTYEEYLGEEIELKETKIIDDNNTEEEITNQYEELLDDIFERNDEKLDNNEQAINSSSNLLVVNNEENKRVSFKNIKENTQKMNVFYIENENEIDKIATREEVGINTIFSNKWNKDYMSKKRIIIEEK